MSLELSLSLSSLLEMEVCVVFIIIIQHAPFFGNLGSWFLFVVLHTASGLGSPQIGNHLKKKCVQEIYNGTKRSCAR